jgi:type I restriction enzyme, S subunit
MSPTKWERAELSQVASIERESIAPAEIAAGTAFVGLENIDGPTGAVSLREVGSGEIASTKYRYGSQHVLYGKLRPNLRKIGRANGEGVCSTDILPILPGPEIDRDYLFHYLRHQPMVDLASIRAPAANLPRLSPRILGTFPICFPPLPEQRRIAAILDKADAVRRKRQQTLELADQVLRSAFLDMFGDPVTNPKGWPIRTLGEICTKVTDGTHNSPPVVDAGIPYITAKHIKPFTVEFKAAPWYVAKEHHDEIYSRCDPVPGDVLYIKDGVTTGIAAVNRYDFEFSMLSSVALLRPDTDVCLPDYLAGWLNDESAKLKLLRGMSGAAIRRLTLAKIRDLEILLPPLKIQQEYSDLISVRERLKAHLLANRIVLDDLLGSLIQRAFRGEL